MTHLHERVGDQHGVELHVADDSAGMTQRTAHINNGLAVVVANDSHREASDRQRSAGAAAGAAAAGASLGRNGRVEWKERHSAISGVRGRAGGGRSRGVGLHPLRVGGTEFLLQLCSGPEVGEVYEASHHRLLHDHPLQRAARKGTVSAEKKAVGTHGRIMQCLCRVSLRLR